MVNKDKIRDFVYSAIVFFACSMTGVGGLYAVYKGLPMLYNELVVSFSSVIVQYALMVIPVIISIICCSVYVYLLAIGSVILFACCADK